MRIETNTTLANRNRKFATYLFLLTFGVLIGSFFLINQSLFTGQADTGLLLVLQILALPVAFGLTLVSIRMTNLWARHPRPENTLEEGLKGLSKKSVLYHYHHIPARHVLIAPQGIFAITTRWHNGKYSVHGSKWKSRQGAFSRMASALRLDGVGNPTLDAQHAANHLEKLLKDIAPGVEVTPLVVFVDSRAQLEIEDPEVPVLYADPKQKPNLKDFMRDVNRAAAGTGSQKSMPLTDEQITAFEEATLRA